MNQKNKVKIGIALKELRLERKISQRKMAEMLGVNAHTWVIDIENGKFKDEAVPKRYCAALGLKFYGNYSFKIV